jgi:sugar transferase (PEP-CTERM/EpsH1 system associated)
MKILWVKAGGLVPLNTGGKIRSYHILKELARKHDITLYTYYGEHPNDEHHHLEHLFARVVPRPLRIAAPRSFSDYTNYALHFFSSYPHTMSRYYRAEISQEVRRLAQSENYDVMVCDFLHPARVIPWDVSCPKILFTHNIEAAIYRRHYETATNPMWKIAAWREYRLTSLIEQRYLEQADHVLTVSDADRESFSRHIDSDKITTVPTGVDVEYFQPASEASHPDTLVFTGSMDWLPNEDAMLYFSKDILPRIRSQVPDVSALIVGRRPSPKLQALVASDRKIHITGEVADVRPYVRQGTVFIVPLRIGGGTRLKIFEAMAMAKAVVSTSIGAEGLPVKDGANILIADSPEGFAQGVARLLQDPVERNRLGTAARQFVEQAYSWTAVVNQFESVLTSLVDKKSECPPSEMGYPKEVERKECGFTRA